MPVCYSESTVIFSEYWGRYVCQIMRGKYVAEDSISETQYIWVYGVNYQLCRIFNDTWFIRSPCMFPFDKIHPLGGPLAKYDTLLYQ